MGLFQKWFGGDQPVADGDPARVAEVEHVLDEIRPMLAADGGDVDVVSVDESGCVTLRWRGACKSCGARETTAGAGLRPQLASRLPWFSALVVE